MLLCDVPMEAMLDAYETLEVTSASHLRDRSLSRNAM